MKLISDIEDEKEKKEKEKEIEKSIELYYKIDKKKIKELEDTFKSEKLKVSLSNAGNLGKNKIYSILSSKCYIYDNINFNKLFEIEIENIYYIQSVIELDNNDLIFICISENDKVKWKDNYELYIYRLKDQKYSLVQKIKEDRKGYRIQYSYSHCHRSPKEYEIKSIKKLSGNRFMIISNYGIKLYCLNNNNKYSLILMDTHLEGIEKIFEINEKELIFCTNKHYKTTYSGPAHDYLLIEKIKLNNIEPKELEKKLNELNDRDYESEENEIERFNKNEEKELISSLKLISSNSKLFEYSTYEGEHCFSDYIILKNKYFVIMVDNHILIFNLINGKQIIRYTILPFGEGNSYKWNNKDDNEFLLIEKGNLILFELYENKEEGVELKIIGYTYIPDINGLIKINNKNRFYRIKDNSILFY